MHCRTSYPTNNSTYSSSSFLFVHSDYTNTLNPYICSSSSPYHDQILPLPPPPPPPPTRRRRRRRRLEDPVITYASNYYVTYSRQTSHSPPPSPQSSPLPSHNQIYPQSSNKDIYCDLFNLLECPPPVKQRRKYTLSDYNLRCRHRSTDYKNTYAKVNNEQKHQQPSYYNENNHQEDKLPATTQQYNRLQEKTKPNNSIYQRNSSSKGFFRRVACNYFCMPMTVTNGEISS